MVLLDEDEEVEESAPHEKRRFGPNKSSLADAGRIVERCSRALLLGDHGAPQRRLVCCMCVCAVAQVSEKGRLSASVFRPPAARSLFIFPRPRTRQRGRAARPTASSLPPSHPTARWAFSLRLLMISFGSLVPWVPASVDRVIGRYRRRTQMIDDRQAWGTEPLAIRLDT